MLTVYKNEIIKDQHFLKDKMTEIWSCRGYCREIVMAEFEDCRRCNLNLHKFE